MADNSQTLSRDITDGRAFLLLQKRGVSLPAIAKLANITEEEVKRKIAAASPPPVPKLANRQFASFLT